MVTGQLLPAGSRSRCWDGGNQGPPGLCSQGSYGVWQGGENLLNEKGNLDPLGQIEPDEVTE